MVIYAAQTVGCTVSVTSPWLSTLPVSHHRTAFACIVARAFESVKNLTGVKVMKTEACRFVRIVV